MELNQTITEYQLQIQKSAKNGQITNLDEFQDGRVIKNLLEQGHLPENIGQAIAKFSPVALRQAAQEQSVSPNDYATRLINKGQSVIKAINDIKEFDTSKFDDTKRDSFSEYKYLVQQHIQEKNSLVLNSRMDADMALKMLQRGYSKTDIEEAILKMSPVAQEAGRSPQEYSAYVVNKTSEGWEKYLEKRNLSEANYSSTAKEYLDRKEAGRAALIEGRSEAYQDGRIVRELMNRGHTRDSLIKVIAENASTKANRTPDGYANYITNSVVAEIRAEESIRSFDISSIKEINFSEIEQEYLQRAQKFLAVSQAESFSSFIDDRVVTSLVKDGFDKEEIKKAISDLSPVGKRPGIVLNYSDKVIEKTDERIAYEETLDKKYPAVAYAYMQSAQLLKNANPGRDYSDYMDGKIAARLLAKGHDKENIQKVLGELSMVSQKLQQEKGWDGERYGRSIVNRAMQSIERYEAAKYVEVNWETGTPPAKEAYQSFLNASIDPVKPYLNAGTDINISRVLFEHGYDPHEIKQVIIDVSPIAIEPGRNPKNYAEYVQEKAFGSSLEKEDIALFLRFPELSKVTQFSPEKFQHIKELLSSVPEVENGKKLTAAEGYRIEAAKLIVLEKGWKGPESDIKISQSLLLQGYDRSRINAAINKQSPEIFGKSKEEARKYSTETTKKALTPEIKKQIPTPVPRGMAR